MVIEQEEQAGQILGNHAQICFLLMEGDMGSCPQVQVQTVTCIVCSSQLKVGSELKLSRLKGRCIINSWVCMLKLL